ncbi:MAG: hypothetical protein ABUJ92_14140, partial [Desulfobacterales bacterium]
PLYSVPLSLIVASIHTGITRRMTPRTGHTVYRKFYQSIDISANESSLTRGATISAESQIGICCGTDLEKQICFNTEQLVLLIAKR